MGDAAKEESPVLGLTIQLYKYGLNTTARKNDRTHIFGFYDSLEIKTIRHWLEFSPRNNRGGNDRSELLRVSHYPVKMLFPAKDEIIQNGLAFCYDEWKKHETLLERFPCMTIVLITLTDDFIDSVREGTEDKTIVFSRLVQECCKKEELQNSNCCILSSIGYSDCCVLMAGEDWGFAMKLLERLHSIRYSDKEMPVVSTDYMMPVFHRGGTTASDQFHKLRLSVRVNLKAGYTAKMLAARVPDDCSVFRTSSGADCLMTADSSRAAQKLLDFLLDGSDKTSNNFVIDMSSTLRMPVEKEDEDIDEPKESDFDYHEITKLSEAFETVIKNYEILLTENKRHVRQADALREVMSAMQNICRQRHTGELRQVMLILMGNFLDCMERCISVISQSRAQERQYIIRDMENQIDDFRDYVGSFLADLSRSDCFFMEREQYNHSSVSSATQLLLSYNRWLNEFSKRIQEVTLPGNKSAYAFLVTSGGCDYTKTYNVFYFLTPEIKNGEMVEKPLYIIQMSEMSLFDFSGTIFRITHECMHYCGDRLRRERTECMIQFIARYYAETIGDHLFPLNRYYDNYIRILEQYCVDPDDGRLENIKKELRKCVDDAADAFIKEIEGRLLKELQYEKWNKDADLAVHVKRWLTDRLTDIFSANEEISDRQKHELILKPFAVFLCLTTQETIEDYLEKCDRILRYNGMNMMFPAFDHRKQSLLMKKKPNEPGWADQGIRELVQIVLSQLLMFDVAKNTDDKGALQKHNIIIVLENLFDIFSESFSDVVACVVLDAGFADYIMMRVYEAWDLNQALIDSVSNTYRLLSVLYTCFPEYLTETEGVPVLEDKARNELADAIDRLEAHGMRKNRLTADELCEKINSFLERKEAVDATLSCLNSYLEQCKKKYGCDEVKVATEAYRSTFKNTRLLKMNPYNTEHLHESVLDMVRAFRDL